MDKTALIINQTEGEISFQVEDLKICETPLTQQKAKTQLEERVHTSLIAFSHTDSFQVVQPCNNAVLTDAVYLHPLFNAVHMAFSEHRPLLLTPDAIWMTIAQGFAIHVNNNAEQLRQVLVAHSEKLLLKATIKELSTQSDWVEIVKQWTCLISEYVNPDVYSLMQCDFSTTTPTVRTASQIVMMDAFRSYFDFRAVCVCGIPWITLQGTEADWCKIRERVALLEQYDLNWWTTKILPICDKFIDTIKGKPDIEFWQSIYKPKKMYATELITGWLGYLFPYIEDTMTNAYTVKNPMFTNTPIHTFFGIVNEAVRPESLPGGLSQVSFTLEIDHSKTQLELIAGFIGVCQNQDNGCLYPEIGWAVRENKFLQILNTFKNSQQTKHHLQPPADFSQSRFAEEIPKEIFQMLEHFDGGTLFADSEHPWIIRPLGDYVYVDEILNTDYISFYHFADLKDGRCLAYKYQRISGNQEDGTLKKWAEWWIVVSTPIKLDTENTFSREQVIFRLEDTKIIATSIPQLFERILQADGKYYFDSPDFIPDCAFNNPNP
jgi:Domain of unknown function (DUF4419)